MDVLEDGLGITSCDLPNNCCLFVCQKTTDSILVKCDMQRILFHKTVDWLNSLNERKEMMLPGSTSLSLATLPFVSIHFAMQLSIFRTTKQRNNANEKFIIIQVLVSIFQIDQLRIMK